MEQYFELDSKKKAINSAKDMKRAYGGEVLVIEEYKSGKISYVLILNPEEYFGNYKGQDEFIKKLQVHNIFKTYKTIYRCL